MCVFVSIETTPVYSPKKTTSSSAIVCAETLSCSVCEAMHVSAECVTQSLWVITIHFAFCQSGSVSEAFPAVRSEWKGCILTRCVALVMRSSQLKCGQPGLRLLFFLSTSARICMASHIEGGHRKSCLSPLCLPRLGDGRCPSRLEVEFCMSFAVALS